MSAIVSVRKVAIMLVCATLLSVPAWAQTAGSTIHGMVKDESGGAVPGVTVTVAAPELQVGKIAVVTGADGNYRIGDLPVGTYRITLELPGFRSVIQTDFRLAIGFVARVDATMVVGGIEESVTVSGASPVVDMTSTTTSANLTRETLDSVPIGQSIQLLFSMTPGLTQSRIDVGDSQVGNRAGGENYGPAMGGRMEIDGIDIQEGTNVGVYMPSTTLDEVQIRTSGNDAEVSGPGVTMVGVIKSGSNQFHGTYNVQGEWPELQSDNLNDTLRAQGLTNTNPIVHLYDGGGDLGGRIIRDKLWFYGALSRQDRLAGVPGFASGPGPDGRYMTTDDPPAYVGVRMTYGALKVSYQPTPKNRLIAAWNPNVKWQPHGLPPEPSRFNPLESTLDYHNPSSFSKGELQSTLSNWVVLNVVGGYSGYLADYAPWRSKFAKPVVKGNPSTLDRETGLKLGANPRTWYQKSDHWHLEEGISLIPERFLGGRHELKTGTSYNTHGNSVFYRSSPAGNYILVFDRVGSVSRQPVEIQIRNAPATPIPRLHTFAAYLKDTWRVSDGVTVNMGVRFERIHAFMPKQSREASPDFPTLFPAQSWDPIDVNTWTSIVPRVGMAWNVAEKTVVKGTFGVYNNGVGTAQSVNDFNPNANITTTYRWRDLDGNGDYTPGEVNLDRNGGDFLSTTGISTTVLNKDLRQPMTTEATLTVERELRQNLGFRVLYVFKNVTDQFALTNVLLPRSAYNIPLTRRDPGPDGVLNTADDGGNVTIYDYDPAYRGAAFVRNEQRNSDRDDHYQSIEMTMTKRMSGRWSTTASFWVTKYYAWQVRHADNPNNDVNALDQTLRWAGNLSGNYQMPWGIKFGVFLQSKIGLLGQRTNVFRAVDPDGGLRLNQLSTVTLRLDPNGAQQGAAINVVNLRSSKSFSLRRGQRIEFNFDLFNLLNSSSPTALTFASGPTFGYASDVLAARIARVGARYSF